MYIRYILIVAIGLTNATYGIGFSRINSIDIYNCTDDTLYVAPFCYHKNYAGRVAPIQEIAQGKLAHIQCMSCPHSGTRKLVFDYDTFILDNAQTHEALKPLYSRKIGNGCNTLYITKKDGILRGYSKFEWRFASSLQGVQNYTTGLLSESIKKKMRNTYIAKAKDPYHSIIAQVRIGNGLCAEEKEYLTKRTPVVKHALEQVLTISLDGKRIPKIAVITSGGGFRAIPYTLGFLSGLQTLGLLDATTYIASLSGSTLAIAGWIMSDLSPAQFGNQLFGKISTRRLRPSNLHEIQLLLKALLVKKAFNQPTSIVDFFGLILANTLLDELGDKRFDVLLSQQAQRVANGLRPLPLYAAIHAEEGNKSHWYEFTPYEVGAVCLGAYIPTWAYGRKFVDGFSVDYAPELNLGFCLGAYNAAFGAPLKKLYSFMAESMRNGRLYRLVEKMIIRKFADKRLTAAEVFNFTAGIKQCPMRQKAIIKLGDAGVDINVPYPLVSGERPERSVDIIICINASRDLGKGKQLRKMYAYAKERGLKFPVGDYEHVDETTISVFKDDNDPSVPMVIYMPRILDKKVWDISKNTPEFNKYKKYLDTLGDKKLRKGPLSTDYTEFDAQQIAALADFNVCVNKDPLFDAIKWKIEHMQ